MAERAGFEGEAGDGEDGDEGAAAPSDESEGVVMLTKHGAACGKGAMGAWGGGGWCRGGLPREFGEGWGGSGEQVG